MTSTKRIRIAAFPIKGEGFMKTAYLQEDDTNEQMLHIFHEIENSIDGATRNSKIPPSPAIINLMVSVDVLQSITYRPCLSS